MIGVRHGMFGISGSGDVSGYGRLIQRVELPGSTPRPYGGYFDDVVDRLAEVLGPEVFAAAAERVVVHRGQLTLEVRRTHLLDVASALRDDEALRFELCCGVSGVHYPDDPGRELHAFYPLMSITHNRRVHLEVACPDSDPISRRCSRCTPPATGTSARPMTSSASSSTATGPDPHRDARRLGRPSAAQDYPLGGVPVEFKGAQIPPPDQRRAYR